MRDIPGVAWILGIFLFCAFGIFSYSKLGSTTIAPPTTVWKYIEELRSNIQYRRIDLKVNQSTDIKEAPYEIHIERLPNQKIDADHEVAKYMMNIKPSQTLPVDRPWLGLGVEMGWVDFRPSEAVGSVRLVSVHKLTETH